MKKYDYISTLAQETAANIVKSSVEWMKYLTTAARLYKYPFCDQLLIYAQRPDATACASMDIWNEKMHCWVNRGASGIALIDESAKGKNLNMFLMYRMFMQQIILDDIRSLGYWRRNTRMM